MYDIECQDTIVACATPPGEGGVAIVRLSGDRAIEWLRQSFRRPGALTMSPALESHRLYYGHLHSSEGERIDEVMVVTMQAPRSFTREDVAEVHCHGGQVLVQRILAHFQQMGARLAQPGEFTFRAFIHQRLDLTQAEAVIELIHARSDRARQLALQQLDGRLSQGIHTLQQDIADLLSLLEAWIDFSEEELERPSVDQFLRQTRAILDPVERILQSYDSGRAYLEGISILLVGKPNVGKSSLLNALLQSERAIVTDLPGTTRDFIEEGYNLDGLPLRLVDTAGLREATDQVEMIGVDRTREKLATADLVLLVLDSSAPLDDDDRQAIADCPQEKVLVVLNKSDRCAVDHRPSLDGLPVVALSAKEGTGLDDLKDAIKRRYPLPPSSDGAESVILTEQRHWEAIYRCRASLEEFCRNLQQEQPFELLAVDLRAALDSLRDITGETTPDQILGRIFDRFCIGK